MTTSDLIADDLDNISRYSDFSRFIAAVALCCICLAFLIVRVPVVYFQSGGQDEDCYAIPGWTITKSGIPQLPHVPSRNKNSVYYKADQALFAEPPLYFYFQSLFYLVLPATFGTGRLASVAAGLGTICAIYLTIRGIKGHRTTALTGAGSYALSHWRNSQCCIDCIGFHDRNLGKSCRLSRFLQRLPAGQMTCLRTTELVSFIRQPHSCNPGNSTLLPVARSGLSERPLFSLGCWRSGRRSDLTL